MIYVLLSDLGIRCEIIVIANARFLRFLTIIENTHPQKYPFLADNPVHRAIRTLVHGESGLRLVAIR